PPESLKSAVEALATIEQLAQHTTVACPKCEAPKPASGTQPGRTTPGSDPGNAGTSTKPSTEPTPAASTKPSTTPSKLPDPSIVQESTPAPPGTLKTPPKPSSSHSPTTTPTVVPTIPTPGTPSWPWPFPSLSLPSTPIINIPGVIQTLLPPWK